MNSQRETGCCPRFNPEPWDGKEIIWQNKLFIKDQVKSFLHIPLNFGNVMMRNMQMIESASARNPQNIVLSDESSLWRTNIYIAVEKELPNTNIERISGVFLTKVFEGSYKNIGRWIKEMKDFVKTKGKEIKRIYFFYTTCPKCVKAYGKNYVVLLAKI